VTKSQLIEELAQRNGTIHKKDAEYVVSTIFDSIAQALGEDDRVEIRGFGSFTVRQREARQARNPKTGELIHIAPKKTPFFKTGKELRQRVDGNPAS